MQFRFHIIAYPYPINFFFSQDKAKSYCHCNLLFFTETKQNSSMDQFQIHTKHFRKLVIQQNTRCETLHDICRTEKDWNARWYHEAVNCMFETTKRCFEVYIQSRWRIQLLHTENNHVSTFKQSNRIKILSIENN